jgi:cobalt/nickel transport system ATP-binding protein
MSGTALSSPIDRLLHDFQERDRGFGLSRWDGRVKLALLTTAVAANVVVADLRLSLFLFAAAAALTLWSRIPLRLFLLFFLAPLWATTMVFAGFSVGFGTTPVASLGPVTVYREGMGLGAAAAGRVASDMAWMAVVFATTPFREVLAALRWFRVPEVLVDTIATGYRYGFLFVSEFKRMRDAIRMRGGFRTYRDAQKNTARILAQVLLRAYDRARRIQVAMLSRGGEAPATGAGGSGSGRAESCPNHCEVTPDYENLAVPILRCAGVSHCYGEDEVLRDVSFSVDQGGMTVLCGPNGAGKTTLLKLMAGILVPDSGDIFLCGHHLDKTNRNDAFRYVGYLSQDPNDQLFCTHVREDVSYGPRNLGLDDDQVDQLVDTAMDLLEVSHLQTRPIHKLSYGEMKRVGLAGLIAMRPPLLLLDEPTANLDPAAAQHLVTLLNHLNGVHGYTFVIVTHDMEFAATVARQIIILDDHGIKADRDARAVLTDGALLRASRLEPPFLTRLFRDFPGAADDPAAIPVTIEEARHLLAAAQSLPEPRIRKA